MSGRDFISSSVVAMLRRFASSNVLGLPRGCGGALGAACPLGATRTKPFMSAGDWPVLFAPPALVSLPSSKRTPLRIVRSVPGRPWTIRSALETRMVRPTLYYALWQRIEVLRALPDDKRGLIIVGPPGIGKTLCLDLIAS